MPEGLRRSTSSLAVFDTLPSLASHLSTPPRCQRKTLCRNEPKDITDAVPGATMRYLVAKSGLVTRDDTTSLSTSGYRYFYDAWNRVVKVTAQISTSTVVAEYRYNGLGQRIGWKARFDTGQTYANNKWRYFQYTVCTGAQRTCTSNQ